MLLEDVIKLIENKDYDNKDLVAEQIFKLADDLEELSGGKLTKELIVSKLIANVDIIRFGDYKDRDPDWLKEGCDPHTKGYNFEKEGYKGIRIVKTNLNSEVDIEHTLTHELIHALHRVYDEHGNRVENGLKSRTRDGKNVGNQINEGAVEFLTKLVMEKRGIKGYETDRYKTPNIIAGEIFKVQGIKESVTDFVTNPMRIIKRLEKIRILERKENLYEYVNNFLEEGRRPTHEERTFFEKYLKEYSNILNHYKNMPNAKAEAPKNEVDRER